MRILNSKCNTSLLSQKNFQHLKQLLPSLFSAEEKVQVIEYGYSNLRIAVIAYIICGECEQGKESETVFCKLKRDAPQPLLEQTSKQCQMPRIRTQYSKNAVPSDSTAIFDFFERPKNNTCSNIRQIAFSVGHGKLLQKIRAFLVKNTVRN